MLLPSTALRDSMQSGLYKNNLDYILQDMRSLENNVPMKINFINLSSEEIRLFWVDNLGNYQMNGTLKQHETRSQKTFATHPWILSRKQGKICIYDPPKLLSPNTIINLTVLPNFDVILKDIMQQGLATTNLAKVIDNIPKVFSHNPISINFINLSDELVTYACLDEYGNEYKHGSLRPNETKSQKTFATHPWS